MHLNFPFKREAVHEFVKWITSSFMNIIAFIHILYINVSFQCYMLSVYSVTFDIKIMESSFVLKLPIVLLW